jgi:hypothetical protein
MARPEQQKGPAELVREVERLRGVIRTAVAALSYVGAHDEASRVRAALETARRKPPGPAPGDLFTTSTELAQDP